VFVQESYLPPHNLTYHTPPEISIPADWE